MAHEKAYQTTITYNITVSLILFFLLLLLLLVLFMKFLLSSCCSCFLDGRTHRELQKVLNEMCHWPLFYASSPTPPLLSKKKKEKLKRKKKRLIFMHAKMRKVQGDLFLDIRMCENRDVWESWWGWTAKTDSYFNSLIRKFSSSDNGEHFPLFFSIRKIRMNISRDSFRFFFFLLTHSLYRQTLQWNENTSASGDAITII